MKQHQLDAYLIPSEDAHSSEYVAEVDQRRAFISGFTGSAGTALVTQDTALVWTDSRYFVQAETELVGVPRQWLRAVLNFLARNGS